MKLDPRIIEGKKPLTCFDTEIAKQFIGKECYFCDCPLAFGDLDKFTTLVRNNLFRVQDTEKPFLTDTIASFRYAYCLPCEWVETSDDSETKDLKKEIEDLRKTVESLKSEINSLKNTIKTNSNRIHTIAQLQYGTLNPQANCSSEFVKQVLGVS